MDRGNDEGTGRISRLIRDDVPQKTDPVEQRSRRFHSCADRPEDRYFALCGSLDMVAVAHIIDDPADSLIAAFVPHVEKMGPGRPDPAHHICGKTSSVCRPRRELLGGIEHRDPVSLADPADLLRVTFAQIDPQFVIDLPEALRIPRVKAQLQKTAEIRHCPMRKEADLRVPDPVRDPLSLKQVDKRNRALVVAHEDCRQFPAVRGDFGQVRILRAPALQADLTDSRRLVN